MFVGARRAGDLPKIARMAGSNSAGLTFAAVTVDDRAYRRDTRTNECTAEQELVVAELKGEGGWLTCS